jgi:hypothetical protein
MLAPTIESDRGLEDTRTCSLSINALSSLDYLLTNTGTDGNSSRLLVVCGKRLYSPTCCIIKHVDSD